MVWIFPDPHEAVRLPYRTASSHSGRKRPNTRKFYLKMAISPLDVNKKIKNREKIVAGFKNSMFDVWKTCAKIRLVLVPPHMFGTKHRRLFRLEAASEERETRVLKESAEAVLLHRVVRHPSDSS